MPFYHIKKLSERHHLIKRLMAQGKSRADVARELNMPIVSVSLVTGSPLFKEALRNYRERVEESVVDRQASIETALDPVLKVFDGAKVRAAEKIVGLMENAESEGIQRDCAFDTLNRLGYKPKETKESGKLEVVLGDKHIQILQVALDETA